MYKLFANVYRSTAVAIGHTLNFGPTIEPLNCSFKASELPLRDHEKVSEKVPSKSDWSCTRMVFTSPTSRVPSRGLKLNFEAYGLSNGNSLNCAGICPLRTCAGRLCIFDGMIGGLCLYICIKTPCDLKSGSSAKLANSSLMAFATSEHRVLLFLHVEN